MRDTRSSLVGAEPDSADTGDYARRPPRFDEVRAILSRGAVLVACLTLAACGSSPAHHATATATARPVAGVTIKDIRFRPHRVVVRLGETVRWTNDDGVAHTVASQALRLASDAIRPGEAFSYRPRRTGTFAYFCTIHAGQTGVLVVR